MIVNGGTFGGTGAITGGVTVNTGGTLSPGASIESLSTGSVSLTSGATLALEFDLAALTPESTADLLSVTGAIDLGGSTLSLSLASAPAGPYTGTFLVAMNDASDGITCTFNPTITGLPVGWSATIDYAFTGTDTLGRLGDGNDIALTLIGVPEPSGVALLSIASIAVGGVLRRRSH